MTGRGRGLRAARLAIAAAALGCGLGAAPAKQAPSEQELRSLRGRIEKLQAELESAEKSSGEAGEQLRASAKAVSEAHRALHELQQRRGELERELAEVTARVREARGGIAREEAMAAQLLRLQHRQGVPDRLRLALEGRDAASVSRQLAYYGYIQRARLEMITGLRRKAETLASLEREALERRDALAANEAQQAEEARTLERERAGRAALVAKLAGEIERGRREIGRLKRDEARLTRLVEEIARALAARRPEPPSRRDAPRKGQRVEEVADATSAAKPFDALRGKMRLPVRGELVHRYGTAREEAGSTWKGLFIRSPAGEAVRAVADGRVVYSDWLRGFGNLLILDHGKGFMSLYGNNEGLLRKVGDSVRGGEPVASVGATGSSAESGLYFELRRDGKPFDPMQWVAP